MNVTDWANRIIRWGFYLLFILIPIILTPWNYELFEYNKMMLTYGLTVVILGAWAVKMVSDRQIRIAKTPLDIPIALFILSQLVSAIFSIDPHVSWWGYYSRFNGGMLSISSYTILYYAFVTNFGIGATGQSLSLRITRLAKVMLTTGAVIALYGVLEHFGIDKNLWVQDVQSRVFSTLGQPNWLAAYLVAIIPITITMGIIGMTRKINFLAIQTDIKRSTQTWLTAGPGNGIAVFSIFIYQNIQTKFSFILTLLFFITLLWTRSRSGYLGLAVADAIFWLLLFVIPNLFRDPPLKTQIPGQARNDKSKIVLPFVICHLSFIIIIFFNGTYIEQADRWVTFSGWNNRFTHKQTAPAKPQVTASGTTLEFGGTESGTIRKYVWQGAVNAWRAGGKNMMIGTGTETFAFAFYQYRPVGHNLTTEWDYLYNKAHNEYLNYLATTGIFGLGSYLFFLGSFIFWFIKMLNAKCQMINKQEKNSEFSIGHLSLDIGLFSGWCSILVTNLFGFSVVIMQLFLFLFPAIIIVMTNRLQDVQNSFRVFPLKFPTKYFKIILYSVLLIMLFLLLVLYRYWYADTLYATGNRLGRSGSQLNEAQTLDSRAIALNPAEPVYHDELASVLASLSLSAAQEKNATLAADLAKQSLAQSDRAIGISPNNVNFWKTRTKIYYTFSAFDPTLNQAAIGALEKARALSPNDPKIYYNLAILYGRDENNDKAIELLSQAKKLKADYRDTYFALYVFYTQMKKPDLARAELQEYLDRVDPTDKDFQERLTK